MSPGELVRRARAALRDAADESVRAQQRSYFKPWERVQIYGVNTPEVRRIERELYGLVRNSWNYPEAVEFCDTLIRDRYIEMKSLGLTLLARYHREFDSELLDRIEQWLACDLCDNWAVTDQLATQIISRVLENDDRLAAKVEKWNGSKNLWLRRASAVSFVKLVRRGQHLDRAYQIVTALLPDDHDLIHKGTGWLLREAGKTNAGRLEKFLLANGPAIPRTTVRYAIERFPQAKRRSILQRTRSERRMK